MHEEHDVEIIEEDPVKFTFTGGKRNFAITSFILGVLAGVPFVLSYPELTGKYSTLFLGYGLLLGAVFSLFGLYYGGVTILTIRAAKNKIVELILAVLGMTMSLPCLIVYPCMLKRFLSLE